MNYKNEIPKALFLIKLMLSLWLLVIVFFYFQWIVPAYLVFCVICIATIRMLSDVLDHVRSPAGVVLVAAVAGLVICGYCAAVLQIQKYTL